ncbi:SDR family NAD(P)-dependent oxidoreductase [Fontisphaera persica]|uniref:SDR family NAD(P)-dependent oxidoreductase n=1 Tax=Fontisphaera persica TaxID=2974023 RepID=UPI0024BFD56A|nr:SDR family NAD(P)-dependent oxidoreductase [Fontisphaera persica]WCJ59131.1 SDR family NAD(P)-dependent oxidoreductase [Fontisphaera persica]
MADANTSRPSRVALVTGAAGGLGRALVEELLAQGWQVGAGWHQKPISQPHPALLPVPLDVTSAPSVQAAVQQLLDRWHRLDLLIHNAGLTRDSLIAQMQPADWEAVLAVNLKGAFLCARAALPVMQQQRSGHIIHISSHAARAGTRGQANYAAAKAALLGLTLSLAREAAPYDVRVNAVLPGVLPTEMTRRLRPEQINALAEANLLRRLNDLAEVARFVVFLAGMKNVSGQIFQLDSRLNSWT